MKEEKMKLSKEEFLTGCVVGVAWFSFMKWGCVPAGLLSGFLWALGGAAGTSKNWRRIGVPLTVGLFAWLGSRSLLPLVGVLPFYGVLTLGYGVPDGAGDDGSWLGRFWMTKVTDCRPPWSMVTPVDMKGTDVMVRGTIAALIGLSMVSLAWINVLGWIAGLMLLALIPLYYWMVFKSS